MLYSVFVVLSLISIYCAYVMYTGGRIGEHTSNKWWILVALPSVLVSLNVVGLLFKGSDIFVFTMIGTAILVSSHLRTCCDSASQNHHRRNYVVPEG